MVAVVTDSYGNFIRRGDIIGRVNQGRLTFHKVIRITKSGNLYISRRPGGIFKNVYYSDNDISRLPEHTDKGGIYMSRYTTFFKVENENRWVLK